MIYSTGIFFPTRIDSFSRIHRDSTLNGTYGKIVRERWRRGAEVKIESEMRISSKSREPTDIENVNAAILGAATEAWK